MDRKQEAFSKRMRTFMAGRNGMDELCGTAVPFAPAPASRHGAVARPFATYVLYIRCVLVQRLCIIPSTPRGRNAA